MLKSTPSLKPSEVTKGWVLIDADGVVLGRLAVIIANRLRGKHKPQFTPHVDCGDNVVVVNAAKVRVTGNKAGPVGVLLPHRLCGRHQGPLDPSAAGIQAPRACAGKGGGAHDHARPAAAEADEAPAYLRRPEHPHDGQQPQTLDVAAMNPKNKRG